MGCPDDDGAARVGHTNLLGRRLGHEIKAFALLAIALLPMASEGAFAFGCPERPRRSGCGCKGGPGYCAPDGHCVGFRKLDRICGMPPTTKCIFENAPGTGANHDCALAPDPFKAKR
jgi:hypothetical protein